jgi:hypothetical protein
MVGEFTVVTGIGLMVMVNVVAGPVQPPLVAVTEMVDVIGDPVLLIAVKAGNPPVPLAASPIEELELVQLKVAPPVGLPKPFAGTAAPAQ